MSHKNKVGYKNRLIRSAQRLVVSGLFLISLSLITALLLSTTPTMANDTLTIGDLNNATASNIGTSPSILDVKLSNTSSVVLPVSYIPINTPSTTNTGLKMSGNGEFKSIPGLAETGMTISGPSFDSNDNLTNTLQSLNNSGSVSLPEQCTINTATSKCFTAAQINEMKSMNVDINFKPDVSVSKSSCTIQGGIGWIVCPVVNFLAGIADGAFTMLKDRFLNTSVNILNTDKTAKNQDGTLMGTATYDAWQSMRSIANVAFVITFLIIIFSQITSVGITNYGIKKMLPRLIIAAILVNLSFFVCQIAVDLSNILGNSLKGLLEGISPNAVAWGKTTEGSLNATGIAGGILTGTVAVGVALWAFWGALAMFIPVILAVVVVVVMTLFILVARQAIIILLIVISPLAFVAFLLPNTEQWFKKWQTTFTAMLLLFPIISLVFGASSFASIILSGVFNAKDDVMGQIVAAAVLTVPLFIVPGLLKKSLDAIPALGQLASKWSDKATSRVGGKFGEAYKSGDYARGKAIRDLAKSRGRDLNFANRVDSGGLSKMIAGGLSGRAVRSSVAGSARATVAGAEAKELGEALQAQETEINEQRGTGKNPIDFLMNRARTGSTAIQRKAALHGLAKMGQDGKLRELADSKNIANANISKSDFQSAITANANSLASSAPDLVKGNNDAAFNNMTGSTLAGLSADTAEVYMNHLETLRNGTDIAKYNTAVTSFNSAVQDIVVNTSLQSTFKASLGNAILNSKTLKTSSDLADALKAGRSSIDPSNGRISQPQPSTTPSGANPNSASSEELKLEHNPENWNDSNDPKNQFRGYS